MPHRLPCDTPLLQRRQFWLVAAVVALAHAGAMGVLSYTLRYTAPPPAPESVIMATIVAQPAPPQAFPRSILPVPAPASAPTPAPLPATTSTAASPAPAIHSAAPTGALATAPATDNTNNSGNTDTAPQLSAATAVALVLPSSDAAYLNNPAPTYPHLSRRRGEEGTVVLRVYINTDGEAEKLEVSNSSGHARLDQAALHTVQNWRFVPGKRAGVPEAMWFDVPIRYVLN
jgi:periplasmic protein TonB